MPVLIDTDLAPKVVTMAEGQILVLNSNYDVGLYQIFTSAGSAITSPYSDSRSPSDDYKLTFHTGEWTFSKNGDWIYRANHDFGTTFKITTFADNEEEDDEYFIVTVHDQIGEDVFQIIDEYKVIIENVEPKTEKICFLDLNGDGVAQQSEVNAYNNGTSIKDMGVEIRTIERELKNLEDMMAIYNDEMEQGVRDSIVVALETINPASAAVKGAFGKVGGKVIADRLDTVEQVLNTGDSAGEFLESQSGQDLFNYGLDLVQFASGLPAVAAKSLQTGMALGEVLANGAGNAYYFYKYKQAYKEWSELSIKLDVIEEEMSNAKCIEPSHQANEAARTQLLPSNSLVELGGRKMFSISTEAGLESGKVTANSDVLGTDEADVFNLAANFDDVFISGAGGIDTIVIEGNAVDIYITSSNNLAVVTHLDSTIVTIDVERLKFNDGSVALDISGVAGQAYRLYQAALDRTPDNVGLGYWIKELDEGKGDLAWMAANFIISEEFKDKYGTPETVSNDAFLKLIYNNVLDRDPDVDGQTYWQSELENGFARERVLASFSESNENQANVIGQIEDGIFYL